MGLAESGEESPGICEVLTEMLRDEDPQRRYSAAWAVGQFGMNSSVAAELLGELLHDPEYQVRECALEVLSKVTALGMAPKR